MWLRREIRFRSTKFDFKGIKPLIENFVGGILMWLFPSRKHWFQNYNQHLKMQLKNKSNQYAHRFKCQDFYYLIWKAQLCETALTLFQPLWNISFAFFLPAKQLNKLPGNLCNKSISNTSGDVTHTASYFQQDVHICFLSPENRGNTVCIRHWHLQTISRCLMTQEG